MPEQTYVLPVEAAEIYESTFVPALFDSWARHLVDFAGIRPGGSVLDVACGTGVVARTAADPGRSVRLGGRVGRQRRDARRRQQAPPAGR